MATLEPLGPPIKINPTIKLLRWSLLGLGIFYGVSRNRYLQRKEDKHKAYLAEMEPVWAKEREEEKQRKMKIEFEELKKQGIDLSSSK